MSNRVSLEPFRADVHLPFLESWLHRPHVAPWYARPEGDLAFARQPPPGGHHALIAVDGSPVGYLRWQHVDRESLDAIGLAEIPDGSVDADILLGEATGAGAGPTALELLARRLRSDPSVPLLGLTTDPGNLRAHRAFEKAGFRKARTYRPDGSKEMLLMIRDLAAER